MDQAALPRNAAPRQLPHPAESRLRLPNRRSATTIFRSSPGNQDFCNPLAGNFLFDPRPLPPGRGLSYSDQACQPDVIIRTVLQNQYPSLTPSMDHPRGAKPSATNPDFSPGFERAEPEHSLYGAVPFILNGPVGDRLFGDAERSFESACSLLPLSFSQACLRKSEASPQS